MHEAIERKFIRLRTNFLHWVELLLLLLYHLNLDEFSLLCKHQMNHVHSRKGIQSCEECIKGLHIIESRYLNRWDTRDGYRKGIFTDE